MGVPVCDGHNLTVRASCTNLVHVWRLAEPRCSKRVSELAASAPRDCSAMPVLRCQGLQGGSWRRVPTSSVCSSVGNAATQVDLEEPPAGGLEQGVAGVLCQFLLPPTLRWGPTAACSPSCSSLSSSKPRVDERIPCSGKPMPCGPAAGAHSAAHPGFLSPDPDGSCTHLCVPCLH